MEAAHSRLVSTGEDYWARQVKVQMTEAEGWIAFAEGKNDEAVSLMRKAADEEDAVEKRPVTPGPIVPAREQLGDLLLQLKRPEEATKEFETALKMAPNRRGAVQGSATEQAGAGVWARAEAGAARAPPTTAATLAKSVRVVRLVTGLLTSSP